MLYNIVRHNKQINDTNEVSIIRFAHTIYLMNTIYIENYLGVIFIQILFE